MVRLYRAVVLVAALALPALSPAAVDLAALWDFGDPAGSERRLRAALVDARGDDALVVTTQIARTHGLRRDFDRARSILAEIEPMIGRAGAEARVHYHLELGRTYASAVHPPESRTPANRERARTEFAAARTIAGEARRDDLAIDAIHMLAFVDPAPEDQLRWARESLAVVEASSQPEAKRWEASIRNNLGYALHQLGRYDEALDEFRRAVAIRERGTNAASTRVAWWMVAWTLRAMNRLDEALAIQSRLERDNDDAGRPDPDVYEELAALHRAKGDATRAADYDERRRQALARAADRK